MAGTDSLRFEALGNHGNELPRGAANRSTEPERQGTQDGNDALNRSALTRSHTLGAWVAVTLLAVIGVIPVPSHWKPVLMSVSQTIAIAVGGLWALAMARSDNWLVERSLASELKKAEILLAVIETDPNSSDNFKTEARKKVEQMRMLKITLHSKRMQAIVHG